MLTKAQNHSDRPCNFLGNTSVSAGRGRGGAAALKLSLVTVKILTSPGVFVVTVFMALVYHKGCCLWEGTMIVAKMGLHRYIVLSPACMSIFIPSLLPSPHFLT